jgi:hypothetical protein
MKSKRLRIQLKDFPSFLSKDGAKRLNVNYEKIVNSKRAALINAQRSYPEISRFERDINEM